MPKITSARRKRLDTARQKAIDLGYTGTLARNLQFWSKYIDDHSVRAYTHTVKVNAIAFSVPEAKSVFGNRELAGSYSMKLESMGLAHINPSGINVIPESSKSNSVVDLLDSNISDTGVQPLIFTFTVSTKTSNMTEQQLINAILDDKSNESIRRVTNEPLPSRVGGYLFIFRIKKSVIIDTIEHRGVKSLKNLKVFKEADQWNYPSIGLERSSLPEGVGCGYELIRRELGIEESEVRQYLNITDGSIGLTPEQILKVFEHQKQTTYIFDMKCDLICKYMNTNDISHRRVKVFVVGSQHIYTPKEWQRAILMKSIKHLVVVIDNSHKFDIKEIDDSNAIKNVYTNKFPDKFEDNTRYQVDNSVNNLTFEYFQLLNNGNIYASDFNNGRVTKIKIRPGVFVVANSDFKTNSVVARTLGIPYTTQSIATLAYGFFQKVLVDNKMTMRRSEMTSKVYDIMTSSVGIPGAPNQQYAFKMTRSQDKYAVDFYRQYASMAYKGGFFYMDILSAFEKCRDEFDRNYLYFVETKNSELFQGNGVYLPEQVELGLEDGIITMMNCKYRIRIHYDSSIDECLKLYIDSVYNIHDAKGFSDVPRVNETVTKQMVNFLIGLFGSKKNQYISHSLLTDNEEEAQYYASACVDTQSRISRVNVTRPNMKISDDDKSLWSVVGTKIKKTLETDILIRFKVASQARLNTYRLVKLIKNAGGIPTDVRTDSVSYIYNKRKFKRPYVLTKNTNRKFGCIRKDIPDNLTERAEDVLQPPRTHTIYSQCKWNIYNAPEDKDFNCVDLLKFDRAYIQGKSGTGKSYNLMKLKKILEDKGLRVATMAFTNSAALLINGKTCHSSMYLHDNDKSPIYTDKFMNSYDVILNDEGSMNPKAVYNILVQAPACMKIYMFADFRQTKPIEEGGPSGLYCDTQMFGEIFQWNKFVLNKQYRSNANFVNQCCDIQDGKRMDLPDGVHVTKNIDINMDFHIVKTNHMRTKINNFIISQKPGAKKVVMYEYKEPHEFTHMFEGMRVIANHNCKGRLNRMSYHNNERFVIDTYDDSVVKFTDGNELDIDIFQRDFRPGYATTVHKAQGITIDEPFAIYELDDQDKFSVYVAYTRTANPDFVHIVKDPSFEIIQTNILSSCEINAEPDITDAEITDSSDLIVYGQQYYHTLNAVLNISKERSIIISREVQYAVDKPVTRQYTSFDDYDKYKKHFDSTPEKSRHFHEIVRGDKDRRLCIDYDKAIDGWYNTTGVNYLRRHSSSILGRLAKTIILEKYDIVSSVSVYNNSRPKKISFHIVAWNVVGNVDTNRDFANTFKQKIIEMDLGVLTANNGEVDMGIYKSVSSLRTPGSRKMTSVYPKPFNEIMLTNFDPDRVTSVISGIKRISVDVDLSHEKPNDLMLPDEYLGIFKFRNINGQFANFTRVCPSYCSLCKREHTNDNTLYAVKNDLGSWVFKCNKKRILK